MEKYYIDIEAIFKHYAKKNVIVVTYSDGLNKIEREYEIGKKIPTVIEI